MITFLICLAALVTAYFTYGKYLERQADADDSRPTPCKRLADGVDFIAMPRWRVFLIQLLNIAGTGPIFGAILGACFGPVAFLWITLGGIFFGAMHDYLSGMMIVRGDGRSLPEIAGEYLGTPTRHFMRWFSIVLMVLVGAVFLLSPAQLLSTLVDGVSADGWVWIILAYYVLATVLPVDKVIGRCYPVFGAALIIMALSLLGVILVEDYSVPELTSLHNYQPDAWSMPIIPTLFITIACGAISGFHATQSPMMARCVGRESECRSVFYGSMISESIIALIWAAIAMAFFGGVGQLNTVLAENGDNPAWAVDVISHTTLGRIGGVLAILGVVAAPITSGDTAFRSARLIISDMFKFDQKPLLNRFAVCIPLFVVGFLITQVNFGIVWRYFAWCNQTLAAITLWAIYVWLVRRGKNYWVALIPALVMTYIVSSFVFISDQFAGMQMRWLAYALGGLVTLVVAWGVMSGQACKTGCKH
ncbi:MAG: carbon starvation CstA family protein [Bacteroidales bacterium]|nr:carbon starvation CstA family protein [Bacteroidales bacterium]